MRKFKILFFVLCAVAFSAHAQEIPLDPEVRMGVLPNGLTYYIRHNEWPEKRMDFYIAQKVGSMQEEEEQRGLAHFLEHMCFNGTTHFPGSSLKEYLERIGVKFGENLNAYTSFDETVYNINNVNVEVEGALDSCLLILHDWSHDLTLDDKEIDKERGVINEEWRMRRSAMMRMQENAFRTLFAGSKYAERMPIGTMDVVMNFPYDALKDYYHRWYRPDLQAIIVVGDVDVAQVEEKIKTVFADIPAPDADASVREYFPVPDNQEPLVAIEKDKEQSSVLSILMFKTEAVPFEARSTMQYFQTSYMRNAVCAMLNDRLSELARKEDTPFSYAQVDYGEYLVAKTKDCLETYVVPKDGKNVEALASVYREMLRAQRGGFTAAEYERFKQEMLSQLDAAYERRHKRENTSYVNEYVRHFLDNEPSPGIEWERAAYQQLAPAVTVEAINAIFPELTQDNRAIAYFMPDKEDVAAPTKEEILQALAEVDKEEIEAYQEEVNTDPLVPELESGATVKSIKDDVYGSRLITLSNGIRVRVLHTDYTPNSISMYAGSWGGSSLYPNSEYLQADNASIVSLGGLGNFSMVELGRKLAGVQASVSPSVGDRLETVSGSCVKKDFETMLQLTYLTFTSPRRDDEVWNSTMQSLRTRLKNADLNPKAALQDSLASVVYKNNVRALRMKLEDVDRLDYDRIMEIYRERFANAGDFDFYLVGDLHADSVAPLIAKYLGALPVGGKSEKYRKIDKLMTKGEHTCIFEKEQDTPSSLTNFYYHAPLKNNMRNSILTSMLEQSLDMTLMESVREDEGGAYGVPVSCTVKEYPERIGVLQVQLPTAPEKRERMTEIIYKGLEEMAQKGPSADQMDKIKEYMLRSHKENLKSNAYWMNAMVLKTRYKYELVKGYEKTVQAVTAEDVRKLAARLIHSGNRIVVGMTTPMTTE